MAANKEGGWKSSGGAMRTAWRNRRLQLFGLLEKHRRVKREAAVDRTGTSTNAPVSLFIHREMLTFLLTWLDLPSRPRLLIEATTSEEE